MRLQSCISLNQGCKKPGDTEKKKKKKSLQAVTLALQRLDSTTSITHCALPQHLQR